MTNADIISQIAADPAASSPITVIADRGERVFQALGMTTPLLRFAGVGILTSGLVYAAKPSFAFDPKTGLAKPLDATGENPDGTAIPWYLPGVFVGSIAALLF